MTDLIDAAEVAAIIRVSPRTVSDRLSHRPGFPPAYKPSRERLWSRQEILDWVETTRERRQSRRSASSAAVALK